MCDYEYCPLLDQPLELHRHEIKENGVNNPWVWYSDKTRIWHHLEPDKLTAVKIVIRLYVGLLLLVYLFLNWMGGGGGEE